MTAASIRYNNPGAMWGGNAISRKWGETANIVLNDGLNQNNHIAMFPDKVHGAAAQFDLWNHSYTGTTLARAVQKWSGGNSSIAYLQFLEKGSGLQSSSQITTNVLASRDGLNLLVAQAHWEAGQPYPMTAEQWLQAQAMVFPKAAVTA